MKAFSNPEMMVHVAMCTHKEPEAVLVVTDSAETIKNELDRYRKIETVYIKTSGLLDSLRNVADKSVDIVLVDTISNDSAVSAHLNRALKETGLCVMKHPHLDDIDANTQLMGILGNYFKIIMPYAAGDGTTLLLCSKEYHPTADLILQRSDLLEGHQYYNCDIHIAAFAMPQYVRKNYLGIVRN